MKTLKQWLLAAAWLVLLTISGLCLIGLLTPNPPGVTRANFKRVQNGMTEQQVEAIFGFPGSDSEPQDGKKTRVWIEQKERRYGAWVTFDSNGKVAKAVLFPESNVPP
jgi:outer membrane protein assembly factor BamE (lipoprotein component of BamABCDE complex)